MRAFSLTAAILFTAACAAPPPPSPPRPLLDYIGAWGLRGEGPGRLQMPRSLTVDFAGNVYVADAGNQSVHKFDPRGRPLLSFSDPRIVDPQGLAVDLGGAIYVADSSRNSILIFFPDGEFLREVRGAPGKRFAGPVAIAVTSLGDVFVLERGAGRIRMIDARSRFVHAWGEPGSGPGELQSPVDMALAEDGLLYVSDDGNHRIQKFSQDGERVGSIGESGNAEVNLSGVTSIAVARAHIFVCVTTTRSVDVFTLDGRRRFSEPLTARLKSEAREASPNKIAASPRGEILVLDPLGARVLRFHLNL